MTTVRHEIQIEGSADGFDWKAYNFRFKPDTLSTMPRLILPHMPRLDWQMWFAALSGYRNQRWFMPFAYALLRNEPTVTHLLAENPFKDAAPRYVRARIYEYRFTTPQERKATKHWWKRTLIGDYLPMVSLQSNNPANP
jgi:hypothetical protein